MDFLLNRYRNLTVLLLVIVAQLLLLAYQVKSNQDVRLIRIWAVTAVTPLARVMEVVRGNTIGFVEDYFVLLDVREKNRQLTGEIGKLKLENQYLHSELQTADRARALAAFQSRSPSQTIAARIIGTGPGANSRVVFIDRGTASNVQKGMAVITPDGIVGKVVAAYPTASQVQLITDPNFAAGVISDKNRVHGTLKGQGHSTVMIDYVQNEEKVEVGERFYTSGDDRVFPKGMPVGVVKVVREGKGFNKEIFVEPSGFQSGLEEVLVVIEGVHQSIPDPQLAAVQPVYLQPAAPPDPNEPASQSASSAATDADKLKDRYRKIGEMQNHTYGTGPTPNFNLDPDRAPRPHTATGTTGATGGTGPTGSTARAAAPAVTGATGPTGRVTPVIRARPAEEPPVER